MKLTVQTFLTLDGVMQALGGPQEDPSDTFTHGGWQAPFPDPAVGEFVTELNSHASAFLFGRRTFGIFRGYWPDQTDPANPIATAINSLPKYAVSHSLSQADATWPGEHPDTARLISGDVAAAVQALKDEPGDELQIWGSGTLLQTLLLLAAVRSAHVGMSKLANVSVVYMPVILTEHAVDSRLVFLVLSV